MFSRSVVAVVNIYVKNRFAVLHVFAFVIVNKAIVQYPCCSVFAMPAHCQSSLALPGVSSSRPPFCRPFLCLAWPKEYVGDNGCALSYLRMAVTLFLVISFGRWVRESGSGLRRFEDPLAYASFPASMMSSPSVFPAISDCTS